jgi:hypothetical protein
MPLLPAHVSVASACGEGKSMPSAGAGDHPCEPLPTDHRRLIPKAPVAFRSRPSGSSRGPAPLAVTAPRPNPCGDPGDHEQRNDLKEPRQVASGRQVSQHVTDHQPVQRVDRLCDQPMADGDRQHRQRPRCASSARSRPAAGSSTDALRSDVTDLPSGRGRYRTTFCRARDTAPVDGPNGSDDDRSIGVTHEVAGGQREQAERREELFGVEVPEVRCRRNPVQRLCPGGGVTGQPVSACRVAEWVVRSVKPARCGTAAATR